MLLSLLCRPHHEGLASIIESYFETEEKRCRCEDVPISDHVSVRVFQAHHMASSATDTNADEAKQEQLSVMLYIHGGGDLLYHSYRCDHNITSINHECHPHPRIYRARQSLFCCHCVCITCPPCPNSLQPRLPQSILSVCHASLRHRGRC